MEHREFILTMTHSELERLYQLKSWLRGFEAAYDGTVDGLYTFKTLLGRVRKEAKVSAENA